MATSLLDLPVELQVEVVNNISLYSDLKALCLVCKALYKVSTPRIYYKVDLKIGDIRWKDISSGVKFLDLGQNLQMLSRIRSLLLQPANLCFVKVLKTGWIGEMPTILMDDLLPLLRKNSLIEFSYSTNSKYRFPTPRQLEFLWGRQKRLQNLRFYPHMVSCLEESLQIRKSSQDALLQSFTKLYIGDSMEFNSNILCWPLKNLNLHLLQTLSLNGMYSTIPGVMDLFAGQSFVNLAKLSLKYMTLEKKLTFTNVPKLTSLVLKNCYAHHPNDTRLPLEFPDNFQLQSLAFWSDGGPEPLTKLLTQVGGLKKLVIGISTSVHFYDRAVTEFIDAVMLHKDSLRLFEVIAHFQGYTAVSQIFDRLRLENLSNISYGAWNLMPESHTIFRLSAHGKENSCS